MTENKRFQVTLGSNTVRFVDFEENKQLMSISFKKHNDAIDCQNALKFQCDLLNELNDEVVKGDLFKLTVAMAIQHRINWLKKQIWDNTDRIDELQSLKKELKL